MIITRKFRKSAEPPITAPNLPPQSVSFFASIRLSDVISRTLSVSCSTRYALQSPNDTQIKAQSFGAPSSVALISKNIPANMVVLPGAGY